MDCNSIDNLFFVEFRRPELAEVVKFPSVFLIGDVKLDFVFSASVYSYCIDILSCASGRCIPEFLLEIKTFLPSLLFA